MKRKIELIVFLALVLAAAFIVKSKLGVLYYNLALRYFDQARFDEAIKYFHKSLKHSPDIAVVHYTLANAYLSKNTEELAIEEYKKTIRSDQNFINAYRNLAQLYLNRKNYKEAITLLKEGEKKIHRIPRLKNYCAMQLS